MTLGKTVLPETATTQSAQRNARTQEKAIAPTLNLLALLRRWWWLPLLGLIAGALSGALATTGREADFEARSTLVIGPAQSLTDPREIADSLDALDRRSVVATYALLPSSRAVRRLAQVRLRLSDAQIAEYSVETKVVPDSNVLSVSVQGPNAAEAARLTDEIALQTISSSRRLYSIYSLSVLDRAQLPEANQKSDGRGRAILLGALLGMLIGLLAALILNRLSRQSGRTGELSKKAGIAAPPR